MSKSILYILGILLTILIGTFFSWKYCCQPDPEPVVENVIEEPVEEEVVPETPAPTGNGLAYSDSALGFSESINDNFNFNGSNYTILTPVSDKVDQAVAKLSGFLNEHNDKEINVIGLYRESEENPSAYPNLGIARANAVKNYMVNKGIPSKQINPRGQLEEELVQDGDVYLGPVNYSIETLDTSEDALKKSADNLKAIKDDINANPLILYFETNSSNVKLTAEQREKMAKIAGYLDKVDGAKVRVVGHTDNVGRAASNTKLGLARANTIKGYLVKNTISESKIETSSKGPYKPIASNKTKKGQAKNRRVEVTLK